MATLLPLFPTAKSRVSKTKAEKEGTYDALPSVWHGEDGELLEKMLDFYPRRKPRQILDATVKFGRFWRGSKRPVTGMDIDPRYNPDVLGGRRVIKFNNASFDVVVYDTPPIT